MKKLARQLMRVPRRPQPAAQPAPPPSPNSVYTPLDSWVREQQPDVPKRDKRRLTRERHAIEVQVPEHPENPKKRKKRNRNKVRDRRLSFAVSAEEERIIRRYLRRRNLKLSTWFRNLVFDEMNEELPPRD